MVNVNQALGKVKADLAKRLDADSIESVCREANHTWRKCLLNPVALIHIFAMQILCGNTACTHLRHLSHLTFTASAYCQARKRLPLKVFEMLVVRLCEFLCNVCDDSALWLGHRVWRIDGSSASMPDTAELRAYFGAPSGQKPGCGFPVASTLSLMHAGTGMLMNMLVRPLNTSEMSGIVSLHEKMKPGDVALADRGFCSYAHLCLIVKAQMHAVFRLHHNVIVDFRKNRRCQKELPKSQRRGKPTSRYIRKLGRNDQVVEYVKPETKPKWMSREQYETLPGVQLVRELRYQISQRGFRTKQVTLVTTLTDHEKYPANELARLYGDRWRIETDFGHMKTTMNMEVLRCESVEGVLKELWMYTLMYNLVRQVMLEAALRQKVHPDRVSFIDALRWLCSAEPDQPLIDLIVNPDRPNRVEPRVIKRRMKPFPLMTKPRHELRQELMNAELTD